MAIIDNKGKLFGKVSIIDLAILVIIIGVLAGVGYKVIKSGSASPLAKPDKVQITLFCPETPEYTVTETNIPKGSVVKDGVTNTVFGSVKEVKVGESQAYTPTDSGEFKAASKPGLVSAYVTVEGYGRYSDSGVAFNNLEYSVGQIIEKVKAGKSELRFNIRVYDIKKID